MIAIGGAEIRWVRRVGKIEGRRFQQMFLVPFDGEVVVGPALFHEIAGQLPLCEQGIGADRLTSNLDGLQ